MHMKNPIIPLFIGLAAAFSPLSAEETPEILYLQGFHNDSGSFKQSDPYGWFTHTGTTGSLTASSRVHYFSNEPTFANVNALTPHGDNIPQGYFTANTNMAQFSYTELLVPAGYSDISISFELNHTESSDSDWHMAIRLDSGDWMVSQDGFFATSWTEFSVDLTDSSLWVPFDFDPGTVMGMSSDPAVAYSTISGVDITAVGFFADIRNPSSATHRLDNYTVTGVIPEPSSIAILIGATAFGVVLLRRRKK